MDKILTVPPRPIDVPMRRASARYLDESRSIISRDLSCSFDAKPIGKPHKLDVIASEFWK